MKNLNIKHFTIFDFIMSILIILICLGLAKIAYDDYKLGFYVTMTFDLLALFGFCWVVSGWMKEGDNA